MHCSVTDFCVCIEMTENARPDIATSENARSSSRGGHRGTCFNVTVSQI